MKIIKAKVLCGVLRGRIGVAHIKEIDHLPGHIAFYPDDEPDKAYIIFSSFIEPIRDDGGEIIEIQV